MRIKTLIILLWVFVLSISAWSQKSSSKKKMKLMKSVYIAVMNNFCKEKNWGYVMEDSTRNREIARWGYERYIEWLFWEGPKGFPGKLYVDSSWLPFLKKAKVKAAKLRTVKVPQFKPIATLYILNKDTIAALRDQGTIGSGTYSRLGWMQARITMSDIIFSDKKNMAIVEFSQLCGSLCGEGVLLLLQRDKDKKWKVVYKIQTWVS